MYLWTRSAESNQSLKLMHFFVHFIVIEACWLMSDSQHERVLSSWSGKVRTSWKIYLLKLFVFSMKEVAGTLLNEYVMLSLDFGSLPVNINRQQCYEKALSGLILLTLQISFVLMYFMYIMYMLCLCTLCSYATCEWPEFYVNKDICSVLFCKLHWQIRV